jgi:hypothetical protein
MSQAVAIGALDDSRCIHCALQRALQDSFGHVTWPIGYARRHERDCLLQRKKRKPD